MKEDAWEDAHHPLVPARASLVSPLHAAPASTLEWKASTALPLLRSLPIAESLFADSRHADRGSDPLPAKTQNELPAVLFKPTAHPNQASSKHTYEYTDDQRVPAQAAECSNKDKYFFFNPSQDPCFNGHRNPHSTWAVEENHGEDAEAASSLADIFSSSGEVSTCTSGCALTCVGIGCCQNHSDNDNDGHDDSDNNDNNNDRLTKALSVPSMASDGAPIKMMDDVAQEFEGKVELMKDSSAASTTRNAR